MPRPAHATRPPGPADSLWSRGDGISPVHRLPPDFQRWLRRDLLGVIGQFQQTCEFLAGMQERDREADQFGGLHEGEGEELWAIVETDNTQEAIRVWCEYALFFADPDRYRQNVEDAWTYCDAFPAWDESAPGEMYGIHNSGWGLIAEMAYRRAYGEDRRQYGRRCAELLAEHVPRIEPNMADALMPLVAGWAAGTLYLYGELERNGGYVAAALRIAREVKAWIDANPDRLHNNEIWALCGGTAMWGVLNSLGRADSTATAQWALQRLGQMDVFAGRGQWNNSHNIWYAHAWFASYGLIADDAYLQNAEAIVDSLVAQDTDDDGGLPATIGDPANRDQSWVSAYTAWMGLRNIMDRLPPVDIAAVRLLAPSVARPWPVGEPQQSTIALQQNGALERVEIGLEITGAWQFDTTVTLNGWQPQGIEISRPWTPDEPGRPAFTAVVSHPDDADPNNDTLHWALDILPVGRLSLSLVNDQGNAVGGLATFVGLDWEGLIPPVELVISERGVADQSLMAGRYRITVEPDFPYARQVIDTLDMRGGGDGQLGFFFAHPPVLLVDADSDTGRSRYYESSLDTLGVEYRGWRRATDGSFEGRSAGFSTIIYFTGNRSADALVAADRDELAATLERGDGVWVTGQNIAESLAEDQALAELLHSRLLTGNTRARQVNGVGGDELMNGMRLLLLGNQGAGNQTSPDGIAAVGDATACALYSDRGDTGAAVRWIEESGGRGLFFAFGFEGISGQGGTTTRAQVMEAGLLWLGTPMGVEREVNATPASPLLISAYPNPFNDAVWFELGGDGARGAALLTIYDLQGRAIRALSESRGGVYRWDGRNQSGLPVAAGSYFVLPGEGGAPTTLSPIRVVYLR